MPANISTGSTTSPRRYRAASYNDAGVSVVPNYLRLSLLLLVLSPSLIAQANTNCQQRTVVVSVFDKQGAPIRDLAADDFQASYRGRPAAVVSSRRNESRSGRAHLLFDASGSMGEGDYKWRIATRAASEFISTTPLPTQISFLSFGTHVDQRFDSSGGRQPILNWLADARVHKGDANRTALYGSMMAAIKDFEPARPGDSIYVITDGGENASAEKTAQLARSLRDSGFRLFIFLLPSYGLDPAVTMGARDLLDFSRESGGWLISLPAQAVHLDGGHYDYNETVSKEIQAATAIIEAHIGDFYVVNLTLPEVVGRDKLDWKLQLSGDQRRKRNDLTLAYPHLLSACSQEQVANTTY